MSPPGPATSTAALRQSLQRIQQRLQAHPADGRVLDEAAVLLYQAGQLKPACDFARRASLACPRDPYVFDHLGVILLAAERPTEAVEAARRATTLAPREGALWANLGNALLAAGDAPAAATALEQATSLLPREPLAWFNRGNALARAGRPTEAIDLLRRALALRPRFPEARRNLALLLQAQGDCAGALALLSPEHCSGSALLLATLGTLHLEQADPVAALPPLEQAVRLDPHAAAARAALARSLRILNRLSEAVTTCHEGLQTTPDSAELWNQLGLSLPSGQDSEAAFRHALALVPRHQDAAVNLARLLVNTERPAAAAQLLDSIPAEPNDSTDLQCARAFVLAANGHATAALHSYRMAAARAPQSAQCRWLLATAELAAGDLAAGWAGYEWRWDTDAKGERRFTSLPVWPADSPRSGHLLVWGEQGVGDEVMFASLVPELSARVDRITLACTPRFEALFQRSFHGVEIVVEPNSPRAPHPSITADWQIAAGALPARLHDPATGRCPSRGRTTLVADPARVGELRARYRADTRPLVGLAWRTGNPRNGLARSIAPAVWSAVLRSLPMHFVSLQYGDTAAELAEAAAAGLAVTTDPTVDSFADLDGFAAQIAAMDAVLTIDNSTVHFAGALGIPTWLLVPTPADWRWRAEGAKTPWYDAVHIHRRPPTASWHDTLRTASAELAASIAR